MKKIINLLTWLGRAIVITMIVLVTVIVWTVPIILSVYADNYWILFLYSFWWIPAVLTTSFTIAVLIELI